jgi:hypothetical protein
MKSEMEPLLRAVERLRVEKAPDLPKDLVEIILGIEADFPDNKEEVARRIYQHVEDYLTEREGKKC